MVMVSRDPIGVTREAQGKIGSGFNPRHGSLLFFLILATALDQMERHWSEILANLELKTVDLPSWEPQVTFDPRWLDD